MAAGKRIAAARKVLDGRRIGSYGPKELATWHKEGADFGVQKYIIIK
jgi:hypothetical protein